MGISLDQMPVWDPYAPATGWQHRRAAAAEQGDSVEGPLQRSPNVSARACDRCSGERYPGIKILVHPECPQEVVDLADESGSTSKIIKTVESAAREQMGDRHGIAPCESPEARASGAGDSFSVAGDLHVRDDVPDRPRALVLDAGEPGCRHAGERDRSRRGNRAGRLCAGADVGGEVSNGHEKARKAGKGRNTNVR